MSIFLTLAVMLAVAVPLPEGGPPENGGCLECHASPLGTLDSATYADSPHGLLSCLRCHAEASGPGHAAEPEKPLVLPEGRHARAVYSEGCTKCHAQITSTYRASFHGIAVRMGDVRAATCVDCHGVHEVFGAGDTRSYAHPARLSGTCAAEGCHPGAPPGFADGKEHIDPTQPGSGTDGFLHWVWKFFIALILFDVLKDGPIVMFELLRRIRG